MDQQKLEIIQAHPLGARLDAIRASLSEIAQTPADLDLVDHEGLRDNILLLLSTFVTHPASRLLSSQGSYGTLRDDINRLHSTVTAAADTVNWSQIKPLFSVVLADPPQPDVNIWEQLYHVVAAAQSTPPRKPALSFQQTPWVFKTSSIVNSSERRYYMDQALKDELGVMYVDVPGFYEAFFGDILDLETASEEIFRRCREEGQPLFREGWTGWPETANEAGVLTWLAELVERLVQWAQDYRQTARGLFAQPNQPVLGSSAIRKLGIGFVDDIEASMGKTYDWSRILIPGELKKDPNDDISSFAQRDLARYVKEIFNAQPTRRFVLAFTLCGTWLRLWEYDRLGGIASTKFDIHENGQLLVSIILGFLWMDNNSLGFDSTIVESANRKYIDIERDGKTERLIIDELLRGAQGIVGRATTCWKAHLEGNDSLSFVIKDSWQYPERNEEGKLLQEAVEHNVINVARYYYHETVQIRGDPDDIQNNVRMRLDITEASNYRPMRLAISPQSRASSTGSKRSASQIGAPLPPGKRFCSGSLSPTKLESQSSPNRTHRRVILRDYGTPIYKASSRVALLRGLEGCIQGHESLYNAGLLHRDISINNLMINEDDENPSWPSFLIDLDLAIRVDRLQASGAKEKTGTRAFMSVGVLFGDDHSFMDDLESFFWVLFWICIHYDGKGRSRTGVAEFDEWNYASTRKLALEKLGTVSDKDVFHSTVSQYFSSHYQALIPWVDKLRRAVFPNGGRWRKENKTLYSQMRQILREAQDDPLVAATTY
ncbi:hypothetical protein F4861DRAFT_538322 [Xylaria intraflava]|nr:hypothetical protein F4861DRAFT_538322 [Xylaria intraflava]